MKNNLIKRFAAIFLAATVVVSSANTGIVTVKADQSTDAGEGTEFAVLSTTDMHGKCWDKNVLNDETVKNSLLRVSGAVKDTRDTYGKDNVLLLDNGDLFQGTPVSSYSITSAKSDFSGATPMALCLKYLNYDALSLGNHEFNYTWNTMNKVYDYLQSDVDVNGDGVVDPVNVISANLVYNGENGTEKDKNVFKPYITKDIKVGDKTLKVGILGLENTDCPRWDISDNYPNMRFAHCDNTTFDLADEVDRYVPEMREKEKCDYVIVVYHSGIGNTEKDDLEFGINTENQASRILKNAKSEIDLMVLGHDHSNSYSNNYYKDGHGRDVLVVNGGGTDMTKTVLKASVNGDGKFDVKVKTTENVDLSKQTDDPALKSKLESFANAAITYVNTPCGVIGDGDWDKKTDYYLEQTDTMDLIGRSQIGAGEEYLKQKYDTAEKKNALKESKGYSNAEDVCQIDLSSTSVVVNNNYTVKAGNLSLKDIYKFYKYDNSLYVLPVKGSEIKEILEFIAEKRYGVTFKGGTARFKTIDDYFTCAVFYGLDFEYDLAKDPGNRVTIKGFKNGKAFDSNRVYNLAINNYHLSNGPFAKYKTSDTIWSQSDDLGGGTVQEMIADYVQSFGKNGVKPDRSNWKLTYSGEIPEDDNTVMVKPSEAFDPITEEEFFKGEYADAKNVAQAAELTSGSGTVIGQVICNYDNSSYVIEDIVKGQICGYLVYDKTGTSYKKGDIVAVTGTFTTYNGIPEIKPEAKTDIKVLKSLGADFTIQPQVVTVDEVLNQKNNEYLNEFVVFQNVSADNTTVQDSTGKITIYNGKGLPEGLAKGANSDICAVASVYGETPQLRTGASDWYMPHEAGKTYDPVSDELIASNSAISVKDAYSAEKNSKITVVAQVADKYAGTADGEVKENVILQDVVNGETVGILVYDKTNKYYVGDVIKVTGTVKEYSGLLEITEVSSVERIKQDIAFQPQVVTVAQAQSDDYLSELVKIKDAKLGAYDGNNNTPATDATGTINIYKGSAYPAHVKADDTVALTAVVSKFKTNYQLRVGSSYNYYKPFSSENQKVVDETLVRVPVVETSDVHGFLVDVSSGKAGTYQYRMAYIANQVDKLRANSDILLLDGGDIYQGNPVSNLLEGQSMIAAYDAMKYDAVSLGNHEFDWQVTNLLDSDGTMGKYALSEAVKGDSQIPVVCANMYYSATGAKPGQRVDFTKDYQIIEKKGKAINGTEQTYKIAVFGYVDDYSKDIMAAKIAPYEIKEDAISSIEATAKELETNKTVDATVLLCHAGAPSIAAKLADDTCVDLVCGGHTHANAAGVSKKNGVAYIQPKNQAQAYSYAELCFDAEGKVTVENSETVNVTADKNVLYKTDANTADATKTLNTSVVNISDLSVAAVAPIMSEQIGTISTSLTKDAIGGNGYSSTAGTWMCELANLATGAAVSFTNNGGIRTTFEVDETGSRMLTVGDVYTIAPFCNTLPTFTVTYEKLKEIIEYAVSPAASGLQLRMGGATAYYDDKGIVSTFFVGNTLIYSNGEWKVDKNANVVVCTNEYIATSSDTPFVKMTSNEAAKGATPLVDNESYINVLKRDSKANGGKLYVNTKPTLVSGAWNGTDVPDVRPAIAPDTKPEQNQNQDPNQNQNQDPNQNQNQNQDPNQNQNPDQGQDNTDVKPQAYKIIFNANNKDAKGKMSVQKFEAGKSIKLNKNKFTLKGYTFAGWSTSKNGKVVYSDKQTIKKGLKAKNITLYAVWKANKYVISYDKNHKAATGKMKSKKATYGKSIKLGKNKFKRAGYIFMGWSTSKKGKVKYKDNESVKNLTSKDGKTITLYAVWKKAKKSK